MDLNDLRKSPLFEGLTDQELQQLMEKAQPVSLRAGEYLMKQGDEGDAAFVVVKGEFEVTKQSGQSVIKIDVRNPGDVLGEMALISRSPRSASVVAISNCEALRISPEAFENLLSTSSTAALAVLHWVMNRLSQNDALLHQQERMAALGTLSAGLAHELNNPAAAVRRAADQLAAALAAQEIHALRLGSLTLSAEQIAVLKSARGSVKSTGRALDPVTRGDHEDELAFFLEDRGVAEAWELAPALVSAGLDLRAVEAIASALPGEAAAAGIGWVASGLTVDGLLEEVKRGAERISTLVQAVKNYSFMDRGPLQEIDVREGLESTLMILRHKLGDIDVSRDFAADLPRILGHGSELNQVWTNLIDNAIDAMGGKGQIALRTGRTSDGVEVEIADNGPGVPLEVQERIFRPFFTTKRMGSGTGLGLDIVYRIVVNRHGGTIRLASQPGDTRFVVRLPTTPPLDTGETSQP